MKAGHSQWIDNFDVLARQTGVCAWGCTDASPLPDEYIERFTKWVHEGRNASMAYLERHIPLKRNLDSVLPGTRSVISVAFPYFSRLERGDDALVISRHALIDDYHKVIKERLRALASYLKEEFGGSVRTCVDSAPVAERYWALKCQIGSLGKNGMVYVPGYGSWVFLAEILCTAQVPSRTGEARGMYLEECLNCDLCVKSCPGKAIGPDRCIDSHHCRAYLTIECRDAALSPDVRLGARIYGCDICQEVCPLNINVPEATSFSTRKELQHITRSQIENLTPEDFDKLVKGTSLERITLDQLKRNARIKI